MQDVEPQDLSRFILRDPAEALFSKKVRPGGRVQAFLLGEGIALPYNLVPDCDHGGKVFFLVFSDDYSIFHE